MAKKKIKKFLKKVAPLAALALGATALGRRKQNKTYLDEEGGARSDMRNYGPFSNEPNYVPGPSKYVRSKTVLGAPGIDRIVMLLANEKNIREVTMFPMNQNAQDLMMSAPSEINQDQLKELNLSIKTKN